MSSCHPPPKDLDSAAQTELWETKGEVLGESSPTLTLGLFQACPLDQNPDFDCERDGLIQMVSRQKRAAIADLHPLFRHGIREEQPVILS